MARRGSTRTTIEGKELEKILPCPFCGEFNIDKQNYLAWVEEGESLTGWKSINCDGCGCNPNFCVRTREEAIRLWNSRVTFSEENEFQAGIEYCKRWLIDLMGYHFLTEEQKDGCDGIEGNKRLLG